jgi:membrane-associated protein
MHYGKFILYNVVGGVVWVGAFLMAGFFFGKTPIVEHNFSLVVIAIIAISLLPAVWEFVRSRRRPEPAVRQLP